MLPLALGMTGAMAKDEPLDPASWIRVHEKLRVKRIKLREIRSVEVASEHKNIFSTIEASADDLPSTIRKQLQLMAVLASGIAASSDMLANLWDVVR